MAKTYILGSLGRGGSVINNAGGELFEQCDNGEFASESAARDSANEMAVDFSRDEGGPSTVAIAVRDSEDARPWLLDTVTRDVTAVGDDC